MKKGSLISVALSAAYAGVCMYLYANQKRHMYQAPWNLASDDPPQGLIPSSGQDPELLGWADGSPDLDHAVIYFGGVSESVELRRPGFAAALDGCARYFVPYRGFGPQKASYSTLSESAIKADALRTFDWVASRHALVSVIGRSLGSGVALHVARHRPVFRLALITPYDSIREVAREKYRVLPAGLLLRDRFESFLDAPHVSAQTLAITAEHDNVISPRRWAALFKILPCHPLHVHVPGSNHTNIAEDPLTLRTLSDFMSVTVQDAVFLNVGKSTA